MWQTVKAVILWNFSRTAWQYDLLCLLILAFIFLTPKSWFDNNEGRVRQYLQGQPAATKVILSIDQLSPNASREEIQKRVREMTGIQNAEVTTFRTKQDLNGKTVALEVDIR